MLEKRESVEDKNETFDAQKLLISRRLVGKRETGSVTVKMEMGQSTTKSDTVCKKITNCSPLILNSVD